MSDVVRIVSAKDEPQGRILFLKGVAPDELLHLIPKHFNLR